MTKAIRFPFGDADSRKPVDKVMIKKMALAFPPRLLILTLHSKKAACQSRQTVQLSVCFYLRFMDLISIFTGPPGVMASTMSPTFAPMSAAPMGLSPEI